MNRNTRPTFPAIVRQVLSGNHTLPSGITEVRVEVERADGGELIEVIASTRDGALTEGDEIIVSADPTGHGFLRGEISKKSLSNGYALFSLPHYVLTFIAEN